MLAEFERLLTTCNSARILVRDARYASEKYIDPLSANWGDEGRHQEVFDVCIRRLLELGHDEVARLLREEHKARLKVRALRGAVECAIPWDDPEGWE